MLTTVRTRAIALTSATALALSVAAAPTAVVAQDTPEAAVIEVFTAIEEWRFDDIVNSFCVAEASAAANLDLGGTIAGAMGGMDPATVQAAITFDAGDPSVTILEQDDTTARVRIEAELAISLDPEGARELMISLFSQLGQDEVPDALIDQAIAEMGDQIAGEVTVIDEEADLVLEDGVWKVCSPVGPRVGGFGEEQEAEASAAAGDGMDDTDDADDAG